MALYLVGMTQNDLENIKALTDPVYEHVDGLIWVDHGSTDGTRELLEERKGNGKIIDKKWCFAHDISLSAILLEGGLKPGDWFVIRDSIERFNPEWAQNIKKFFDYLSLQGVKSVWNYGKGFAYQYNDSMIVQGSPHWGLVGAQHQMIDLKDNFSEENKEHTWRPKDGEPGGRPIDNKINHEAKYVWCYGRSNHLLLGRENNLDEFRYLEAIRLHVRDIARMKGFDMTLQGLEDFMRWAGDPHERTEEEIEQFHVFINGCHIWKNFYRKHILKHSWEEISTSENSWKLA